MGVGGWSSVRRLEGMGESGGGLDCEARVND